MLLSSPHRRCKLADPGRDRSRVVLTSNNGVVSNDRYANNMGFTVEEPMSYCAQLMQQYQLTEDEVQIQIRRLSVCWFGVMGIDI